MNERKVAFVNELGNRIVISKATDVRDRDALCTACRWRYAHSPDCERADETWPMVPIEDGRVLISIEGPTSISENYLAPMEVGKLTTLLVDAASEGPSSRASRRRDREMKE